MLAGIGDVRQEAIAVGHFQGDDVRRGQGHRIDMHWKVRRRHDGRIPRADQRQAHVAETLFRSQADDHLVFGIEPHAVLLQILAGHFAAKLRNAGGFAVAVVGRIVRGFGQFFDDQFLGRIRGIAHAQIDDIVAVAAFLVFDGVDPRKQVRRQPLDAVGDVDLERRGIVERIVGIVII